MSFRTRLLTASILIVAMTLTVVMFLSWSRIMKFEVERLDTRLCIEAKRIGAMSTAEQLSTRFSDDLAGKLRVDATQQLLMSVENSTYQINSRSVNWPEHLSVDNLDWSTAKLVPTTFSLKKDQKDQKDQKEQQERQPPARKQKMETCQLTLFEQNQRQWRAVLYRIANTRSFIAVDLDATRSELQRAVHSALIVVVPLALLLCAFSAWLIAGITMRPLNRITHAMKAVTQKDFHHRLPESGEDKEFKILINTYNQMLERLENSFQQASRFSADAAHELKTPLTILRGRLEQAVSGANSQQIDLNSILDEVGKLSAITRKLLLLSQADAGTLTLHYEPIDLTTLLDELLSDLEFLSEEQILERHIERALSFSGDLVLIRQLINNLVSNAIRYHLAGSAISINAGRKGAEIEVIFSNHCHPISISDRARLFDRFFRGDPAHNRSIDGNGLGLSLAREIAKAHGGDLLLVATAADVVTFRLNLPC